MSGVVEVPVIVIWLVTLLVGMAVGAAIASR